MQNACTPLAKPEEVRELTAAQVDELLGRSHGWARRHIGELGGYQQGRRFKFPVHALMDWQRRQAAEHAEPRRIRRIS